MVVERLADPPFEGHREAVRLRERRLAALLQKHAVELELESGLAERRIFGQDVVRERHELPAELRVRLDARVNALAHLALHARQERLASAARVGDRVPARPAEHLVDGGVDDGVALDGRDVLRGFDDLRVVVLGIDLAVDLVEVLETAAEVRGEVGVEVGLAVLAVGADDPALDGRLARARDLGIQQVPVLRGVLVVVVVERGEHLGDDLLVREVGLREGAGMLEDAALHRLDVLLLLELEVVRHVRAHRVVLLLVELLLVVGEQLVPEELGVDGV